jgi:putative N6-adenine-specific DNA methylase
METAINIEKRIKRHVLGKTGSFYVSTLPGIEHLCVDELTSAGISMANATLSNGGVEFPGRTHECYLANLHLRMANRILMRIETFLATNFRQLEKKLAALPWELYLHNGTACKINVATRHSRLFHSDAIADRIRERIKDRWRDVHNDLEKNQDITRLPQQIFVRAANDRFTVSIDSSGDILHKRGLKVQGGEAPIRETTAASILALAGYHIGEPLIDPMCGTGTFSLEGAMIANHIPAGWYRNFAFMGWPCFKPSRWKHIRREAKNRITRLTEPVIFASDKDQHNCQGLETVIQKNDLSGTISVCVKDFFDLLPTEIKGQTKPAHRGLLTINPPYGRRLETKDASEKMFVEICKKLKKDFTGWKIALIAPDKHLVKKVPFKVIPHHLFHGGLHLALLTGRIR